MSLKCSKCKVGRLKPIIMDNGKPIRVVYRDYQVRWYKCNLCRKKERIKVADRKRVA